MVEETMYRRPISWGEKEKTQYQMVDIGDKPSRPNQNETVPTHRQEDSTGLGGY